MKRLKPYIFPAAVSLYLVIALRLYADLSVPDERLKELNNAYADVATSLSEAHTNFWLLFILSAGLITYLTYMNRGRLILQKREEAAESAQGQTETTFEAEERILTEEAQSIQSQVVEVIHKLDHGKDLPDVAHDFLSGTADLLGVSHGVWFQYSEKLYEGEGGLVALSYFAVDSETDRMTLPLDSGLAGQAARSKRVISVDNIAQTNLRIKSALGENPPDELVIMPVWSGKTFFGVVEMAAFSDMKADKINYEEIGRELALCLEKSHKFESANQGKAEH